MTNLEELREALTAGADAVLLDNMNDAQVREAVVIVDHKAVVEGAAG